MLLLFVLVSIISFAGSIHPGTVNLAVIQTTLLQSRRAGLWLALGGSLPEIGYSALAAGGAMLIPMDAAWVKFLPYLPIPVFLLAGLAALRQKPVELVAVASGGYTTFPFWKGVALSSTNPQLLPFWSAVWIYLSGAMLVPANQPGSQWVFAVATASGAFGLLVLVSFVANRYRQRVLQYLNNLWINRLIAGTFISMALWQFIRLIAG
ncbi:MAG: LysE family translocator [Rudanella sp.]|nr:LysE family translocator [Rudanella sp.]